MSANYNTATLAEHGTYVPCVKPIVSDQCVSVKEKFQKVYV